MLTGTYFCYDVVLVSMQGLLLDEQGLESAYPQCDCFVSAAEDRMTDQNLTLLKGCNWNFLVHTLVLHEVGVPSGFLSWPCGAFGSSFDSIILKSDHTCYIISIDISFQGIEIPVCELSCHTLHRSVILVTFLLS